MSTTSTRRTTLTRHELFVHALALLDAEGMDALTMRRLAAELGIEAASLYHHVPGKAALLDGVLALMRSEVTFDEPLPEDWPSLLETVFLRYAEVLMAHPNLLPLAGRHLDSDPAEGLPHLVERGLSVRDAVDLWQGLMGLTVGFAQFSIRALEHSADHLPDDLAGAMGAWTTVTLRRNVRGLIGAYEGASR